MYHSSTVQRSPMEEDDRLGRDGRAGPGIQQQPPYTARSPLTNHYHNHSPTKPSAQQSGYPSYSSRPSSSAAMQMPASVNQSPRLGQQPHSPTNGPSLINHSVYPPRDQGKSTYYDPTSEHREVNPSWNHSSYAGRSPMQVGRTRYVHAQSELYANMALPAP